MIKRLFDILFSLIAILVCLPLFIVIPIIIKRDSKGPPLYKATRVGKDDKVFTMYKFRTMVENADKIGGPSTAGDDPRLTKIGKILRRYQLDELPQLFNILKGEMSFVGPRPEVKEYIEMMTRKEKNLILSVKPGLTDLSSLWDFHEEEILKGSKDPEKAYQEKIRPRKIKLQLKYVKNRSFWSDLKIISKTIWQILKAPLKKSEKK